MLDISSFVSNLDGETSLVYHGGNRYTITHAPRGFAGYELFVDVMSEDLEEIIDNKSLACGSLSIAISTIEVLERGEEV